MSYRAVVLGVATIAFGLLASADASAAVETFHLTAQRGSVARVCSPSFAGGQTFAFAAYVGARQLQSSATQRYTYFVGDRTRVRATGMAASVCFRTTTKRRLVHVVVHLQEVVYGPPESVAPPT